PAVVDYREGIPQRFDPRAGGAELVTVLLVVALEPPRTGAEDEPALARALRTDVVDRACHVGLQVRVAVAVAVHERAELHRRGLLRDRAEHRPRLEVLTVGLATQGEEMVPVEDDIDTDVFKRGDGVADLLVRRVLRRDLNANTDGA